MDNKQAALNYLVKMLNESLHPGKQPAPTAGEDKKTGYDTRLVKKIAAAANCKLQGPTPAVGSATKEGLSQDQALKVSAAQALKGVLKEQAEQDELDEEIARFDADCAREKRQQQQKSQASAPLAALARSKTAPKVQAGKFWQIRMSADTNTAELLLYGEIASERSWLDDSDSGIYADEFVQDLQALGNVSQITCRINSIGGDIFAAIAIYTQLKTHAARIVCIIDGLAASAATLIVMAGDEIQMPIGAMQMIHDPLTCLCGIYNAEDLEKIGETLDTIKESIVAIYADRTGQSENKISALMSEEAWLTTDEAVKLGFCDTILLAAVQVEMRGKVLYMNNVKHDLSKFKNVPKMKTTSKPDPDDTGEPDPDETDNPGKVNKGDGPACDDCNGAMCGGCPCLDCDEDDCDDCSEAEASHANKMQQERAIIGGFIAESANKILNRRTK